MTRKRIWNTLTEEPTFVTPCTLTMEVQQMERRDKTVALWSFLLVVIEVRILDSPHEPNNNIHQLEASVSHMKGNGVVPIVIASIEVHSIPVADGHD